MNEIIENLTNIDSLTTILNDSDRNFFENDIIDELNNISESINQIKKKMSNFTVSNNQINRINEIDLDRRRQKIIWKLLFPQYWTISHTLKEITNDELTTIENDINQIPN